LVSHEHTRGVCWVFLGEDFHLVKRYIREHTTFEKGGEIAFSWLPRSHFKLGETGIFH